MSRLYRQAQHCVSVLAEISGVSIYSFMLPHKSVSVSKSVLLTFNTEVNAAWFHFYIFCVMLI